jgi:hypothetical protein
MLASDLRMNNDELDQKIKNVACICVTLVSHLWVPRLGTP